MSNASNSDAHLDSIASSKSTDIVYKIPPTFRIPTNDHAIPTLYQHPQRRRKKGNIGCFDHAGYNRRIKDPDEDMEKEATKELQNASSKTKSGVEAWIQRYGV